MREFATVGLKLNADQCNIECSLDVLRTPAQFQVDGTEFPIVSSQGGFCFLGMLARLPGEPGEKFRIVSASLGGSITPCGACYDTAPHHRDRVFAYLMLWSAKGFYGIGILDLDSDETETLAISAEKYAAKICGATQSSGRGVADRDQKGDAYNSE